MWGGRRGRSGEDQTGTVLRLRLGSRCYYRRRKKKIYQREEDDDNGSAAGGRERVSGEKCCSGESHSMNDPYVGTCDKVQNTYLLEHVVKVFSCSFLLTVPSVVACDSR